MPNIIYMEYSFKIHPLQPATDILIAELGEAGFESFLETENGVLAYIQKKDWHNTILKSIQILSNTDFKIHFSLKEIGQENWNAFWERNFEPIQVGDKCVVRAPFHERPEVEFDIVIEPKMSFGTGHHETTHLMLQYILKHDFNKKSVLDMGCGTGVLAILAAMKGAKPIDGIDIDHWCYINTMENAQRNGQDHIRIQEGDVSLLGDRLYDIILANINRNILLADIPIYAKYLNNNGLLFLSGFYVEDIPLISKKCGESGLHLEENLEKNNWAAAVYRIS